MKRLPKAFPPSLRLSRHRPDPSPPRRRISPPPRARLSFSSSSWSSASSSASSASWSSSPSAQPAPAPTPPLQIHGPKLIRDYLSPTPSHLLSTTLADLLDRPSSSSPTIQVPPGVLPQGHHLVYFPIQTPPSGLHPDGADSDHSPGGAYPRRMWAGGAVTFRDGWHERLLLDGRPVVCREGIREGGVVVKGGKVFVDVWRGYACAAAGGHDMPGGGEGEGEQGRWDWDIEERRTLVFMGEESASSLSGSARRVMKAPRQPTSSSTLTPSPTDLFHFSALTFNAHAIHFDPLYARREGHRALLVHGPLTLALMLAEVQAQAGGRRVARFEYRNHAPLYVDERMTVCACEGASSSPWEVWVEGPEGGVAVRGRAFMEGELDVSL